MVITLQRNYSLQSRHISLWLMNADCEIISSTIAHGIAHGYWQNIIWYRVILKKVSFGIFISILIAKEEKNLTMES